MYIYCKITFVSVFLLSLFSGCQRSYSFNYEDIADYPLMGDWQGEWIDAQRGHEKAHPKICAQLIPVKGGGHYRVVLIPDLYVRAEPYLIVEVPATDKRVIVRQQEIEPLYSSGGAHNFDVTFEGKEVRGEATLHNRATKFVLRKIPFKAPSVGLKPPSGATVLFDGRDFDAWEHRNGKDVTWEIKDDAMQVVTMHNKKNRDAGLGGDIRTKDSFGGRLRFHMEFRYPVEADKAGQGRGNSGLFFSGIPEIQILNSYTTPNYWNECGALYKGLPAKLDASGPPLEWQTYDVMLELPKGNEKKAMLTVYLNGHLIHNKHEINTNAKASQISLQDHVNLMQFRNIWIVEE